MICDEKGKFSITVLENTTEKEILWVQSPEHKMHYLVTQSGVKFMIKIKCLEDFNTVYGASLHINGKCVIQVKTFKKHGYFHGIKLGDGVYKEFLFKVPETFDHGSDGMTLSEFEEMNKSFGEIRVEFFETFQIKAKKHLKKISRLAQFEESKREDNKKFFLRPLTVGKADTFKIRNTYKDWLTNQKDEHITENHIDYAKKLCEIKIRYSDFESLLIMGVVSINLIIINLTFLHFTF